jgi:hypothetical protein
MTRRNPKPLEDRGGQIVRRAGTLRWSCAARVGCSIDGPTGESAAGEEHGHRPRPVIAAGCGVDSRGPPELTGAEDDRLLQQAA